MRKNISIYVRIAARKFFQFSLLLNAISRSAPSSASLTVDDLHRNNLIAQKVILHGWCIRRTICISITLFIALYSGRIYVDDTRGAATGRRIAKHSRTIEQFDKHNTILFLVSVLCGLTAIHQSTRAISLTPLCSALNTSWQFVSACIPLASFILLRDKLGVNLIRPNRRTH